MDSQSEAIYSLVHGDCLKIMQSMPDNSVDLVICSPPYEDSRSYGIDFILTGQDWVDWCIPRFMECVRICKGLVVWVVDGKTKQFRWSATPALLMADLHRLGVQLRKPPIYARNGIMGSGGPDWWRNDYEYCICASRG
jgi:site-specific DNA-methyltransferase (adenine-specific)